MKKLQILLVYITLVSVVSFGQSRSVEKYDGLLELPRFAVISDIHFGNNVGEGPMVKVPKALKNLMAKGNLDAIFVVGDLTEGGTEEQYDQLLSVFNDKANIPDGIAVYYLMGNHDNYTRDYPAEALLFQNKLNQPLNQYVEIKGYPFITLSQNGVDPEDYNQAAKDFLSSSLADATVKYPGKPVFVFVHVPPANTCYGSAGWGSNAFVSILNQYPQAVVFGGHSHYPIGDPRSIHQDKFTSVNDGSTTYSEIESGIVDAGFHPAGYQNITEGLIVNVMENGNVVLDRWDTYRNEEILPKWVLEAPFDGSMFTYKNRNGLPAPFFDTGAKPRIINNGATYTVQFPQAKDNEVVHRYFIEVMENNRIITTFREFSQFYLNSQMPAELKFNANVPYFDFYTEKKLIARVRAIDSYNNESDPIQSDECIIVPYPLNPDTELPLDNRLMDIAFSENGEATDVSALHNPVLTGSIKPQTYLNTTFNRWAAKFTGNRDCFYKVEYADNETLKKAFSGAFSFEVLYKPNNSSNVYPLGTYNSGGTGIEQLSGGRIQFRVQTGAASVANTMETASAGEYYHVVATCDKNAGVISAYINGLIKKEQSVSGNFQFPADEALHWIGIGGNAASGNRVQLPLSGEIVLARMYDKALSYDEVILLYLNRMAAETNGITRPVESGRIYVENQTLHIEGFSVSARTDIYDLLGRKVAASQSADGTLTLARGIYIVRIWDSGKVFARKVLIR